MIRLTGDPDSCKRMTILDEKDECLLAAAKKGQRPYICDEITSSDTQEDCLKDIALATLNLATCERITGDEKAVEECIEAIDTQCSLNKKFFPDKELPDDCD